MQVFINNNARFCYQSNEKVLSSNTLGRIQICKKKNIKMESVIDDDLEKSSSHESDSKSDKDHDESNE